MDAYRKVSRWMMVALEAFETNRFISLVFAHLIIVGFLLFTSKFLGIDTLHYPAELRLNSEETVVFTDREVGYLWAINWTFYYTIVMTAYVVLFHFVLKASKGLIERLNARKLLLYRNETGDLFELSSEKVWERIIKSSSRWILVVLAISLSLGFVQWYQYSGQWYFNGFDSARFLTVSTGVDWNVAGAIDSLNNENGLAITLFALFNYLYYGIGWTLMFSFYIVLTTYFVELYGLSSARSRSGSRLLLADQSDQENGGFKPFRRIQFVHAAFSILSIISLYLMAVRNNYLPHECRVPALLPADPANYDHCKHVLDLIFISVDFVKPIIESGLGVFGKLPVIVNTLFFNYVPQNTWTLGPFFNIVFICVFFIIISMLMRQVILLARESKEIQDETFASGILSDIKKTRNRTLWLLALGGVGTLYVNIGSLMVIGVVLWPIKILIDYTRNNILNVQKLKQWIKDLFGL